MKKKELIKRPIIHNYIPIILFIFIFITFFASRSVMAKAAPEKITSYSGKKVSILGDSISTFRGYNPKGNRIRYPDIGNIKCDVLKVNDTWWYQLLKMWDAKLLVNDSSAGTRICNIYSKDLKENTDKGPSRALASTTRIKRLAKGKTKPDVILFYGGTNDRLSGIKTGSFNPSKAPASIKKSVKKWNTFADAFVAAIVRMENYYPNAQIIVIIHNVGASKKKVMKDVCNYYNISYVDISNIKGPLLYDGLHPNKKGMKMIADTIYSASQSTSFVKTFPSKVTNVKATINSHSSVRISWKKQNVAGYKIYRSTKKSSGYKCVKTTSSTSWTDKGLKTNKTYYYKIKAYSKFGKKTKKSSKYSAVVKAKPYIDTPGSVKVSVAGNRSLKISWNKSKYAKSYQIYRATSKNGKYKKIKTTSSTSYTNSGLTTGKTYYYKVRAYNKVGKKTYYSCYSSKKSGKTYIGAASSVKASSAGYNSAKITWKAGKYAKGYQIYRATSKNGKYTKIKTTTGTSYTNTGLSTNKTYYYKIRSYNTIGGKYYYSGYSSIVSAKPIPATPTGVSAKLNEDAITIKWNAVSGTSKYYIYRNDGKIFSTTSTSYTDTPVEAGKAYQYRVRAYRTVYSGYSSWSSKVIVSQEAYLDYNKDGNTANATRIYIGQVWTDSLNASLNGGTPVEKLLERDHPQYYEGGTESVYVYDTEDFDNFLIIYVKGGKIIAWQTSAEVLGVYNGITLRRCTPATDYEDFEEWGNSYEFIPYLSVAKVKATNIDIGEIFFGGVVSSMNEWDLRCSDNLEAEELLCEYTINALRVVNGRVIMEHNEYLYGKEDEYGTKAEAKTMAISNELAHGILPEGPLAGLTGTEKGTLISNASGGTVVSGGQNIANGGCGESVVWMWFRSAGHSQSLMASGALNSNFEETNIMAAAVYPTADGSRYYWSWEYGYYKIDYGLKAPNITINEVGEKVPDEPVIEEDEPVEDPVDTTEDTTTGTPAETSTESE